MGREKNKVSGRENDLTIEELRSYPAFCHFTEEQLAEIIATIKKFTQIIYDFYRKNQQDSL